MTVGTCCTDYWSVSVATLYCQRTFRKVHLSLKVSVGLMKYEGEHGSLGFGPNADLKVLSRDQEI